ncbi:hypothetical protein C5B42_00390 [Candidatus Cerribacteria bacterium 'Amazon FNV 2010 28 9']|uniref:Uncharacterized protein n=1 Tax=Candidatus Cerribacteria bacterium 'Amazon FNV 2010 28 9' TaxID=2081795 RepID=A0A317JQ08_9BACT|nr:MAG: hypothetical protein C5B42_00390 [Candidatus Cerribacteria bacterium 'Amazon FNV 2010 28 9']
MDKGAREKEKYCVCYNQLMTTTQLISQYREEIQALLEKRKYQGWPLKPDDQHRLDFLIDQISFLSKYSN